jgi:hypothetical protein
VTGNQAEERVAHGTPSQSNGDGAQARNPEEARGPATDTPGDGWAWQQVGLETGERGFPRRANPWRGGAGNRPGKPGKLPASKPQEGTRAEGPGCAGGGKGLRRAKGRSGPGLPRVEYPEVWQRIARKAENPGAGPRLGR